MKLDRLASTTARLSAEAAERGRQVAADGIRRVEMAEGVEGDRERSLQQELAMADPRAVGEFQGGERLFQDAKEIAAQVAGLGVQAAELLHPEVLADKLPHLDDSA
jgi:hypothetical protein